MVSEPRRHGRELSDAEARAFDLPPGTAPIYVAPVGADPADLSSWTLIGYTAAGVPDADPPRRRWRDRFRRRPR